MLWYLYFLFSRTQLKYLGRNTQIVDTCIVFPGWHISSNSVFVLSCFAIVALGIFYEYLRVFQKSLDTKIALSLTKGKHRARSSRSSSRNTPELESEGLLSGRIINTGGEGVAVPLTARLLRAILYGVTVFLSFFLMLVFMTYNAYLIVAVVLGASIGHFVFGGYINTDSLLSVDGKGMACH
ncbi:hypothetical protein D9757_001708 [Collybiopsis confluens]|uniref:Copper transport protein n=1 Tax=Collybiopsis confluens TaxID=2823264 RepID=A0A8H5HYK4_9AGAR|nr:hypothetical protein D9757_001708 [Collybiopsis confluens]